MKSLPRLEYLGMILLLSLLIIASSLKKKGKKSLINQNSKTLYKKEAYQKKFRDEIFEITDAIELIYK